VCPNNKEWMNPFSPWVSDWLIDWWHSTTIAMTFDRFDLSWADIWSDLIWCVWLDALWSPSSPADEGALWAWAVLDEQLLNAGGTLVLFRVNVSVSPSGCEVRDAASTRESYIARRRGKGVCACVCLVQTAMR
jgi:hypothetical protein